MASNVDKYVTQGEHSAIDHTGLPGVGGGGPATVVGAEVIDAQVNLSGFPTNPLQISIPANTLTADNQIVEITYANSGTPTVDIRWNGGSSIWNAGGLTGEIHWKIYVCRYGPTFARILVAANGDNVTLVNEELFTSVDWTLPLTVDIYVAGTGLFYQVVKWPEAGSLGISGIGSDTLPVGTIVPYAGTVASIPTGFLPCDGSLADQTVEADLFAVIGTTWNIGGEPGGFFRLPDFRGKSVVGLNDGTLPNGADGGFTTRTLAATGGEEAHQLLEAELPTHAHSVTDPGHAHGVNWANGGGINEAFQAGSNLFNQGSYPTNSASTNITIQNTGSDTPHNTMHPFAVCPYIIKSRQVGGGVGVTAQNNGGALQGVQPTLNFIPGGATSVSVVEDVGNNRIDITISSTDANTNTVPDLAEGRTGSIGANSGTYSVGTSWPGGFLPRGLILVTASDTETFIAIGFARGNTGGIGNQGHLRLTTGGSTSIATQSGQISSSPSSASTLAAQTPQSNNWNVGRTNNATAAWSYANGVIGGIG